MTTVMPPDRKDMKSIRSKILSNIAIMISAPSFHRPVCPLQKLPHLKFILAARLGRSKIGLQLCRQRGALSRLTPRVEHWLPAISSSWAALEGALEIDLPHFPTDLLTKQWQSLQWLLNQVCGINLIGFHNHMILM